MNNQDSSINITSTIESTEDARRERLEEINSEPGTRRALEAKHGQVWDTTELQRDFSVIEFLAPFVHVCRRDNGAEGSMEFQHNPRFYFNYRRN
ncbi:MAG: hypothetical protein U0996_26260 [Planctomycetaceae bacterium]